MGGNHFRGCEHVPSRHLNDFNHNAKFGKFMLLSGLSKYVFGKGVVMSRSYSGRNGSGISRSRNVPHLALSALIIASIAVFANYTTAQAQALAVPNSPGFDSAFGTTNLTVTWTDPNSNGVSITGYQIVDVTSGDAVLCSAASTSTSCTWTPSSALTGNVISVEAIGAAGPSADTATAAASPDGLVSESTDLPAAGDASNVTAAAENGYFLVAWTAPQVVDGAVAAGGTPTNVTFFTNSGYTVLVDGRVVCKSASSPCTVNDSIAGLHLGSSYVFSVVSANVVGSSTAVASATTVRLRATPVRNFSVSFANSSSALSSVALAQLRAYARKLVSGETVVLTGYSSGNEPLAKSRVATISKFLATAVDQVVDTLIDVPGVRIVRLQNSTISKSAVGVQTDSN